MATLALGAALGAVYLAGALRQGRASSLDPGTLLALGALRLPLAGPADLPRLLATIFVHVDPQHLGTNLALLLGLGARPGRLEARCGPRRLLGLFLLAGAAGSLASLLAHLAGLWQGPTLVAGASGALCGLAAAAATAPGPRPLRLVAALVLLFLLGAGLVLGEAAAGAAHLGGAALGLALRAWSRPPRHG